MNKLIIRYILLLSILLCSNSIQAQSFNQNDLGAVQVDKLSDDQIRQLLKKAESSGMSQTQLEQMAVTKGMKPAEVQKLRERISKLGNKDTKKLTSEELSDRVRKLNLKNEVYNKETEQDEDSTKVFDIVKINRFELNELEKKIFGYTLFNTKNLSFEPSVNIPTPQNYQIGSGDEIAIDIWGASQATYKLKVTPDGNIIIENIGPVNVNGLSIEKASAKIIGRLSGIYSGLLGGNPNTFAQVSLGNLRSIKVTIVGEVRLPGSYTLSSLSNVFNALYLSGGPSINGSFRTIQVFRDNKLFTTLDVYDFLIKGDQKNNIRLQDQDIIMVKPFSTRVELKGEIKIPALFEMKSTDHLSDLILYSGGFSEKAYSYRVKVLRNTERERKIVDVEAKQFDTFSLFNGDEISVEPILNRFENRVEITGAVYRPGLFELESGMTLKQLINKAEGLRGDAFMTRAILYRQNDDLSISSIAIDLSLILKGQAEDLILKKEDMVKVFSIFDLQEEYNLKVEGEVLKPGMFPFVKDLSLEDMIAIAGGFKESASMARIEIARRIKETDIKSKSAEIAEIFQFTVSRELSLSDSASSFKLMPFDQIYIRRSPEYVIQTSASVSGEVIYPGVYSIKKKDERISDLIERAGGLTPEAYTKGASLVRKINADKKNRDKILNSLRENSGDSLKIITDNGFDQTIGIDLVRIMKKPHSVYDITLQEGDVLKIPKELQTVTLSGALLYPITVRYDKSYGFRKYVSMAGGFADEARSSKAFVVYANGKVDKTSSFLGIRFYPKIEPGAEIIVPKKAENKKMTAQEVIGFASALSSMALIIVTVVNMATK
jgi:protein involved in polysaccharide export with SLBB domain